MAHAGMLRCLAPATSRMQTVKICWTAWGGEERRGDLTVVLTLLDTGANTVIASLAIARKWRLPDLRPHQQDVRPAMSTVQVGWVVSGARVEFAVCILCLFAASAQSLLVLVADTKAFDVLLGMTAQGPLAASLHPDVGRLTYSPCMDAPAGIARNNTCGQ